MEEFRRTPGPRMAASLWLFCKPSGESRRKKQTVFDIAWRFKKVRQTDRARVGKGVSALRDCWCSNWNCRPFMSQSSHSGQSTSNVDRACILILPSGSLDSYPVPMWAGIAKWLRVICTWTRLQRQSGWWRYATIVPAEGRKLTKYESHVKYRKVIKFLHVYDKQ